MFVSDLPGDANGRPNFIRARTAAGLLLVSLTVILFLLDFASLDFSLDSIQLGLLLGTALLLLGVEAGRKLLG